LKYDIMGKLPPRARAHTLNAAFLGPSLRDLKDFVKGMEHPVCDAPIAHIKAIRNARAYLSCEVAHDGAPDYCVECNEWVGIHFDGACPDWDQIVARTLATGSMG